MMSSGDDGLLELRNIRERLDRAVLVISDVEADEVSLPEWTTEPLVFQTHVFNSAKSCATFLIRLACVCAAVTAVAGGSFSATTFTIAADLARAIATREAWQGIRATSTRRPTTS